MEDNANLSVMNIIDRITTKTKSINDKEQILFSVFDLYQEIGSTNQGVAYLKKIGLPKTEYFIEQKEEGIGQMKIWITRKGLLFFIFGFRTHKGTSQSEKLIQLKEEACQYFNIF